MFVPHQLYTVHSFCKSMLRSNGMGVILLQTCAKLVTLVTNIDQVDEANKDPDKISLHDHNQSRAISAQWTA